MELYKKHRPSNLKDVIGQDKAINILQGKIDKNKLPHALLLTGPHGSGKTTIARCLRKPLKCHLREFREYDIAQVGGIEDIREIRRNTQKLPLYRNTKIYFLDEVAQAKSIAQDGMLKMLEESPDHVYFIFATTDPQKLKKTLRSRFVELSLKPFKDDDLKLILKNVSEAEDKTLSNNILIKIVEYSDHSARTALELLEKIIDLDDEEDMIEAVKSSSLEAQAIELCRLLLKRSSWKEIAGLLKELQGQNAEGLRRMVLGYMRTCLLSGNRNIMLSSYQIMTCFEQNFFNTDHAGLAMACWEAANRK